MIREVMVPCLVALAVGGCHSRASERKDPIAEFTQPAPPGQEEKWVEPEPSAAPKPPEPPPAPPAPTVPPPAHSLGYHFGDSKEQSMRRCSKRGAWSKHGSTYACSRPVENASFPGKPVLSFCDEKLCAVGIVMEVETATFEAWQGQFDEMKKKLVDIYGAPTVDTLQVPDECKNESFVKCLDDGTASAESTWTWTEGHRISLTMGKKKSGEGPSAIRYVSIAESPK